jgi:hypothetical protein
VPSGRAGQKKLFGIATQGAIGARGIITVTKVKDLANNHRKKQHIKNVLSLKENIESSYSICALSSTLAVTETQRILTVASVFTLFVLTQLKTTRYSFYLIHHYHKTNT